MKKVVIEGIIQGNESGYAFLLPSNPEFEDFFIPHSELKGALHKDLVLAEATYGKGERTTARVLKILERGLSEVVGTYFSSKHGGFVTPDDKKYSTDVFVPFGKGLMAKSGDKVVCKIIAYPFKKSPEGLIKEVLGRQFSRATELKCIERTYGLIDKFPTSVIKFANKFSEPTDDDFHDRKDFRDIVCFTIDGEDSRDFDDAVSIEIDQNDNYILGVHIADVTHYVKDGNEIDREAYLRGTSVYFPEKVIPMLPENLCNNICSLEEGKDRLAISCLLTINKMGEVVNGRLCKSVIKSRARMTYTNVQKIIDGDKELCDRYSFIKDEILLMNDLSDLLINNRDDKGCVDLDVKESLITVSNNGTINVSIAPRDKAHKIIEAFMISANVFVAKTMFDADIPCVYRVHERPDEEKYRNFLSFLEGLGVKCNYKEGLSTKDYQEILEKTKEHPAFNVINSVMLRSMQKAKYSEVLKGHFGLGEMFYCHFTSPIRRYPDLFVHRVLKEYMQQGKLFVNKKYKSIAKGVASRSSETERNALESERAVDDYYKMLYISDYVGETFDGIISGVTPFGLFVELENGIEGLIKIETIKGKRFDYDDKNLLLTDGNIKYKLGQKVSIKVAGINYIDRRAEFVFV